MNGAVPPPGRIAIERRGETRIVSFHGEHDLSTAMLAWEQLSDARVHAGVIVVDLSAASFIDSAILATLFNAYRADETPRLRFVVPAGGEPHRLFTLVGLDSIVPMFERLEDALSFPGKAANGG